MASAAVPRKSAASSSEVNTSKRSTGWFQMEHDVVDHLPWLAATPCAEWLLLKVISMVNQRSAQLERNGKPATGYTGAVGMATLVKACANRWEKRMFLTALKQLSDEQFPTVVVLDLKAAVGAGVLAQSEVGNKRDSYVLAPNRDAWPEIIRRRRKEDRERRAELKRLKDEEEPEDDDGDVGDSPDGDGSPASEPSRVRRLLRITAKPLVRRPGDRAARIILEPEAQDAMAGVEVIRVNGEHSTQISFQVRENVLECSLADAPAEAPSAAPEAPKTAQYSARFQSDSERKNGETAQYSARFGGLDSFDFEQYPEFTATARKKFPPVTKSVLISIISACRQASMMAGLEPDWASDLVLSKAIVARGVSPKGQNGPGLWLKSKEGPGTLVSCVMNWAKEFAETGHVLEDDGLDGDPVLAALERTRGRW